jgi:hypothetical protein
MEWTLQKKAQIFVICTWQALSSLQGHWLWLQRGVALNAMEGYPNTETLQVAPLFPACLAAIHEVVRAIPHILVITSNGYY